MGRTDVQVTTPDGQCPVVVVTPAGQGPWPAVVMFPDAGGPRATFVVMAETVAAQGYLVLLPELYYRSGPYEPFDVATAFGDPGERARLGALAGSVTKENVVRDVGALLEWLTGSPDVRGTAVGCTGYCMGGRIALWAAGTFPDRIAAAASFHGGNLATEDADSAHLLLSQAQARLYVGVARDDTSFPPEQQERLTASLSGVDAQVEQYDALHGFAVPDNPTFDQAAGRRHDEALRELFAASL